VRHNHEMLCHRKAEDLAEFLAIMRPDALIVDELHLCKTRDKKEESQRHHTLRALAQWCRDTGSAVYGMTGTPVTNEPSEALSLIGLVNPQTADELRKLNKKGKRVEFSMAIHEALQPISSRYVPAPPARLEQNTVTVRADEFYDDVVDALQRSQITADAVMAQAKFDALLELASKPGKLLVFTSAVTSVVNPAADLLRRNGITTVIHTGDDKGSDGSSVEAFIRDPAVKVLVASTSTLATGFDGLQQVCGRICFLTLPWTSTEYDQAVARILRRGITFEKVELTTICAALADPEDGGNDWSLDHQKQLLLTSKRSICATVCDGIIPDGVNVRGGLNAVCQANRQWAKRMRERRNQQEAGE